MAELDLQVVQEAAGGGEDGDELREVVTFLDDQFSQLTAAPAI